MVVPAYFGLEYLQVQKKFSVSNSQTIGPLTRRYIYKSGVRFILLKQFQKYFESKHIFKNGMR